MIVDDPTYEDAARILELMTLRPCKAMRLVNPPERMQGTLAGLCGYEVTIEMAVVFYGYDGLEEESLIVNPEHVRRMAQGETIRYRIERFCSAITQLDEEAQVAIPKQNWPVQTGVLLVNPVL